MEIHNILEEKVIHRVNELYDTIKTDSSITWLECDCEHCRLDVIAYTLNKLPPRYIVSGRGITHNAIEKKMQLSADMDAIIVEGIKKISNTTRPYHTQNKITDNEPNSAFFNFPCFIGSAFDGETFAPIQNATITFSENDIPVPMRDYTWLNPYTINEQTQGVYSFLPKAKKAQNPDVKQKFHFTVSVEAENYENTAIVFETTVTSTLGIQKTLHTDTSVRIQDVYLFLKTKE